MFVTIGKGHVFFGILRTLCAFLFVACASLFATSALAAIPATERQVLIDFYNSTNGDNWTINTGWKTVGSFSASGTECNWHGVHCNAGTHITTISLYNNNLTGTLPATLNQLTELQRFDVAGNQLSGPIPSLTGLSALQILSIGENRLSGSIPSLTGMTELQSFVANNNQLTGSIPPLTELPSLWFFGAYNNQLVGSIPSLAGLKGLQWFTVGKNQLTGNIPSLNGLTRLQGFGVDNNQLTGNIPSLTGLTELEQFYVNNNQLTGGIPSLTGLMRLNQFYINNNQLTGAPPAPPASLLEMPPPGCFPENCLPPPVATLCPNGLSPSADSTINAAWDKATGQSPWYQNCRATPPGPTREYTGQWFKVDEDAWGLSVFQNFPGKPRYLFVPWFTYDKSGKASWYVFQGDNWTADDTLSADVYRYTGPNWGATPYDNSKVTDTKVGTAKLTFTSAITAKFEYNVEGSSRSIDLQKLE